MTAIWTATCTLRSKKKRRTKPCRFIAQVQTHQTHTASFSMRMVYAALNPMRNGSSSTKHLFQVLWSCFF